MNTRNVSNMDETLKWTVVPGSTTGAYTEPTVLLQSAERFIDFLIRVFQVTAQRPSLEILVSDVWEAQATADGRIQITTRLITWVQSISVYGILTRDGEREAACRRNVFFWIVAHEFFHIARAHFDVIAKNGSDARLALEADADAYATVGVYFSLLDEDMGAKRSSDTLVLKLQVLSSLFTPLRKLIDIYSGERTALYPGWNSRLLLVCTVLAQQGVKYEIVPTGKYLEHIQALHHGLLALARHEAESAGRELTADPLYRFLEDGEGWLKETSVIEERMERYSKSLNRCKRMIG